MELTREEIVGRGGRNRREVEVPSPSCPFTAKRTFLIYTDLYCTLDFSSIIKINKHIELVFSLIDIHFAHPAVSS